MPDNQNVIYKGGKLEYSSSNFQRIKYTVYTFMNETF